MPAPERPSELPPAARLLVPGAQPVIIIRQGTNQEFLQRYARPGCVGLSCGPSLVDRMIRLAERHVDPEGRPGRWSHAFFFQGSRADGHHWVVESDLQIHRKHIRLGVQENRLSKYFDPAVYDALAILDFGLHEQQVASLLGEALELVATRTRYSLRELLGTCVALPRPTLRARENLLARDASFFCSAFVQHLFRRIGVDLSPGLHVKHTTPEDLSRTAVPHATYLLLRTVPLSPARARLREARRRLRERLRKTRNKLKRT